MILRCSIGGDVVGLVLTLIVDSFVCEESTLINDSIGRRVWWEGVITVCDQSMYD